MRTRIFVRLLFLAKLFLVGNLAAQTYWLQTNGPYQGRAVQALAVDSSGTIFAGTSEGGVFRSTDEGNSWQQVNNNLPNNIRYLAIGDSNKLYAGSYGFGAFRSTDGGNTWTKINNGLTNAFIFELEVNSQGHVFAIIGHTDSYQPYPRVLFRSTDSGENWELVYQPEFSPSCLTTGSNGELLLGAYGTFARSFDNGASWTVVDAEYSYSGYTSEISILDLVIDQNTQIIALSNRDFFQSPDSGATWTLVGTLPDADYSDYHTLLSTPDGSFLVAGYQTGVLFLPPDSTTWRYRSYGLENYGTNVILQDSSGNFYIGTTYGGVFKNNGLITSVAQQPSLVLPTSFVLAQNYPNPFNPTTTFQFSIPQRSFVMLTISDILGNRVANLAAEELEPGTYAMQWDASGLSSGTYFYRLTAGDFTETRKLILLK